jgi:hypothetical protein
MSTFTVATQDIYESPTTGTTISHTVDIPVGTDGIYFCWVIDDQGTTVRTFTVSLAGSSTGIVEVGRKTDASSNHSAGVYYLASPPSGSGQAVLVSSSPAFNNRAWRSACILVDDLSVATPYDGVQIYNPGTIASPTLNTAVTSEVGDDVLSVGCLDGRSTGTTDWSPAGAQFLGEWNTSGAIYLGIARYAGAASVSTGWAWTGGASVNASEIAFNVNAADVGGSVPTMGYIGTSIRPNAFAPGFGR